MFASDYSILGVFLSTLIVTGFIFWLLLVYHIFQDIFHSHDLSGAAKAFWVLFLFVLPLLGCLVYLAVRGGSMHERRAHERQVQQQSFDDYIRRVANTKE